jgi:hypothetical protein
VEGHRHLAGSWQYVHPLDRLTNEPVLGLRGQHDRMRDFKVGAEAAPAANWLDQRQVGNLHRT